MEHLNRIDLYSFFNSPDIAHHCQKIGKTFNMLEAAVIISWGDIPIGKRISGWQSVLDEYEDMPISSGMLFGRPAIESTAAQLRAHIQSHKNTIEQWQDERGALFCVNASTSEEFYGTVSFGHLGDALSYAGKAERDSTYICVDKHRAGKSSQRALYLPDGTLYDIKSNSLTDKQDISNCQYFLSFKIYIPMPFVPGDVLTYTPRFPRHSFGPLTFVLERIPYNNEKEYTNLLHQGNREDFKCRIWKAEHNGLICQETPSNLYDLCYYRGELKYIHRSLEYISQFYKGKLPLEEMIYLYGKSLR